MKDSDVSLRTNLVTLSDKGEPFADKVIEDYCAGGSPADRSGAGSLWRRRI